MSAHSRNHLGPTLHSQLHELLWQDGTDGANKLPCQVGWQRSDMAGRQQRRRHKRYQVRAGSTI